VRASPVSHRADARPHGPDDGAGGRQRPAARGAGRPRRARSASGEREDRTAHDALTGNARGMKIAVVKKGFGHLNSEQDVDALVRKGAARFKPLGAQVDEVSIEVSTRSTFLSSRLDAHSS